MANIEYRANVTAQRRVCFGDRNTGELREPCRRRARVQMVFEIIHDFVGGLEEATRLRFERQTDGAAGPILQFDEMRGDAQNMLGKFSDDFGTRDARLEAEGRALN